MKQDPRQRPDQPPHQQAGGAGGGGEQAQGGLHRHQRTVTGK